MMTFRNQPSVSAFGKAINPQSFSFSKVSVDDVLKEINKFGNRKAIQSTDIPVKILKQNADIFGIYYHFFNVCVDKAACHLQNFRKTVMQPNNIFQGSVSV